jgi:membrane-associated phospholipid phosphatase
MNARLAVVLLIITATCVALIASDADPAITYRLEKYTDPALKRALALLTYTGEATLYLLPAAAAAWYFRFRLRDECRFRTAVFTFCAIGLSGLLVNLLKVSFGRVRPGGPFDMVGDFVGPTLTMYARSFPSGHATTLGAITALVAALAPRWLLPVAILAAIVGVSRLVVGYHFPSDVIAGFLLGWVSVAVTRHVFARHAWWPLPSRESGPRQPASHESAPRAP